MKKNDYFSFYILINRDGGDAIEKVYGERIEYCDVICGIDHRKSGNEFRNYRGDEWYLTDTNSGICICSATTKLKLLKEMTSAEMINKVEELLCGYRYIELKKSFKTLLNINDNKCTFDIEALQKAIDKYGHENQKVMLFEEMAELQKEICKEMRGRRNRNEIIEETADVIIMIEQLKLMYQISTQEIQSHIDYKIKRLEERLGE